MFLRHTLNAAAVLATLGLAIGVLTLTASDTSRTSAAAPVFQPGAVACFENLESFVECDGDTAPNATADIRTTFCLGWGTDCSAQPIVTNVHDSNFASLVSFVPAGFGLPAGGSLPVGAISGYATSKIAIGLINNPCNSVLNVAFTLMNAGINLNDNITSKPVGEINPQEPLALDTSPANGIPDGVDRYPAYLESFLNNAQPRTRLFGVSKIQGTWRTVDLLVFNPGSTVSIGGSPVTFSPALGYPMVLVMDNPAQPPSPGAVSDFCAPFRGALFTLGKTMNNPCTPVPSPTGANCPAPQNRENAGYPFLPCESSNAHDEDADGKVNDGCPQVNQIAEAGAQCDNNTSDDGEDASINDGCPVFGGVSEGSRIPGTCSGSDEGGCTFLQNPPAAGAFTFTTWAESYRDADGDGIENPLDVCSLASNPGWNPRASDPVNDPDSDGLPSVCDPNPNVAGSGSPFTCPAGLVGPDQDQDCFANRADNCPTTNQLADPGQPPGGSNLPVITDADRDEIGDACDPSPATPNGGLVSLCLKMTLQVGGAPGPVVATVDPQPGPNCATGMGLLWGDVNCSGAANSIDALAILRWKVGLSYPHAANCPLIGSSGQAAAAAPLGVGPDTTIAVESATAPPNSNVTVDVTVTPAQGIEVGVVEVVVSYDNTVLTSPSCTAITLCNPTYSPNSVWLANVDLAGMSGVIGTITFDTPPVETATLLDATLTLCTDTTGSDITCSVVDGTITIQQATPTPTPTPSPSPTTPPQTPTPPPPPLWGDIDCSGTVNAIDALKTLRY